MKRMMTQKNEPKYQVGDRNKFDFNCPICDGWGSLTDEQDEVCDYCSGRGQIDEATFNKYFTPPEPESWKAKYE